MRATLMLYRGHYLAHVLLLYTSLFLFLQTFMVPGCFFLNLLVGAVFPPIPALLYVTLLTTAGCCLNFLLARHLFSGLVRGLMPQRVHDFQAQVAAHQDHLFYYLLCLRIVPVLPAWTLNISCPLARVPLRDFALATAVGFQPQVRSPTCLTAPGTAATWAQRLFGSRLRVWSTAIQLVWIVKYVAAIVRTVLDLHMRQGTNALR